MNKYFDKIFVISLYDKTARWNKVRSQFKRRGIDVERFVAVDGRCKDQGKKGCLDKLRSFEIAYNIKIPVRKDIPLKELIPASSLTIGTLLLLRQQVNKGWKRILICEDDIILSRNLEDKFKTGVKEIKKSSWDLLYLGCGNHCGINGIGYDKKGHRSFLSDYSDEDFYIKHKNDLRLPCDYGCKKFTEHISKAYNPTGTWCYAISLKGAKKILKILGDNLNQHIDQILSGHTTDGYLKSLAFDPPIVMHEDISQGRDTDIPWAM